MTQDEMINADWDSRDPMLDHLTRDPSIDHYTRDPSLESFTGKIPPCSGNADAINEIFKQIAIPRYTG
jgi:hypothetical protein